MVHRVVLAIAPGAPIVDLTHQVPAHDVTAGALALWRAAPYLAPAVVLAVVDPGVGGSRRAVAVEVGAEAATLLMVGPDNGLLTPAAHRVGPLRRAVELDDPAWHLPPRLGSGATFAGRDVFAPAAAHLAAGTDIAALGAPLDPETLAGGAVRTVRPAAGGRLDATVLWVDHFGNVQLDVAASDLPAPADRPGGAIVRMVPAGGAGPIEAVVVGSYSELGSRPGLVPDSAGLVAFCLDRADAATRYGLRAGDRIEVLAVEAGSAGTL